MRGIIIALLLGASAPALAAPADDLKAVIDDHWAWYLSVNPIQATSLGVRDYDDRIGDISLAAANRQVEAEKALLARLNAIPVAELGAADRTNHAILTRMLEEDIEANSFGQRMILFSNRSGWHQFAAGLSNFVPLRTKADHESYLARIAQYPKLNDEAIAITRRAVQEGYMLPCVAMEGFEGTISGVIAADAEKSRFYAPFTRTRPVDVSEAEWAAMQARAKAIVTSAINPAYKKHLDFYTAEVGPKCVEAVGVSAQPNGRAYYDFRIREMTTTDLDADEIHAIGLGEVARIRGEMEKVAKEAGFPSREVYIEDLRTNPKYYAKTPEELMQAVARVNKEIDGKMPGLFGLLPRLPYGIREIPSEIAEGTTTAYYYPGSPESGIAGTYYVNTSKLDQRPLWEVPALSVHEAVPGHHHQIALQQELDMPEFRKHAAFFTAFIEGWGLYSESLGEEMGLYDTPAKQMGKLSYQMWRATRLVVDTGMHAKGWSKQQALDYMKDNTALSEANIEAEVNRYIANPGQALAYKIGELKIKELRTRAEQELGPKFDLRYFHDAVLGQGAVPLDVLERQVIDWIAVEKAKA
ncbi:DUF885 domain-containing protein [Enterovirga sp. GCM10030262]|uniref:DUF885 domain-containing protein n=1 Tax=Enterovirga sp. GCM10030262 TaxID=3273391 RepID=UPI0036087701